MGLRAIDPCEVFVSIWASYHLPGSGRASGWQPGHGPQAELEILPSCPPSGSPAAHREGMDASSPSLASPGSLSPLLQQPPGPLRLYFSGKTSLFIA